MPWRNFQKLETIANCWLLERVFGLVAHGMITLHASSFFFLGSNALVTSSDALVTSSFLLLLVMPFATSSVLATNSDPPSSF